MSLLHPRVAPVAQPAARGPGVGAAAACRRGHGSGGVAAAAWGILPRVVKMAGTAGLAGQACCSISAIRCQRQSLVVVVTHRHSAGWRRRAAAAAGPGARRGLAAAPEEDPPAKASSPRYAISPVSAFRLPGSTAGVGGWVLAGVGGSLQAAPAGCVGAV